MGLALMQTLFLQKVAQHFHEKLLLPDQIS